MNTLKALNVNMFPINSKLPLDKQSVQLASIEKIGHDKQILRRFLR